MTLDPRHLRVLLAVIHAGSFSAAARALNMTQPAVSMLISQLERTVGTKVVHRGHRGVQLTPTGQILARRASMLESVLSLAGEEVSLSASGIQGPLILGGTPGALMSVLPWAVRTLDLGDTRFATRIVEAPDSKLMTMLRDLSIDAAIGTVGVAEPPDDIEERRLFDDEFVLVMRREHRFRQPSATLADLADLAWVLPDVGGAFKRQIEAIFLVGGMAVPSGAVRCDSLATTKEIVRVSDRVTILPSRVVAPELAGGSLRSVVLETMPPPRSIGIRTLRDRLQTPLLDEMIAAIRSGVTAA